MSTIEQDAGRSDPYKDYRFRVKTEDGAYVAGLNKISEPAHTTIVKKNHAPIAPSSLRKPSSQERGVVTLERGITLDPELSQWASKVWDYGSADGGKVSGKDYRKTLIIEVYNEAGEMVMAYKLSRCRPMEFVALPELVADANAIAIVSLKLEYEGLERSSGVAEPTEPHLTEPEA